MKTIPTTNEPAPETSNPVSFHSRLAANWEKRYTTPAFRARLAAFRECLDGYDLRGQFWLDAGCGSGALARCLAHRGCRVLGVDASEQMLAVARRLSSAGEQTGALHFGKVRGIDELPLAD